MLVELRVKNFALLEDVALEFNRGLNVLTGETGAGKSLLIGALEVVLGGRGGADQVRRGSDRAWIEAVFDLGGTTIPRSLLDELGIGWPADDSLLLTREIQGDGRTRARVNDRSMTIASLRRLGRWLIDLHGQHEHQWLLDPERQRDYVDRFANLEETVAEVRRLHETYKRAWGEWTGARRDLDRSQEERELREYQRRELAEAGLRPDEDASLEAERERLSHADRLQELVGESRALIDEEGAVRDRLGQIERILAEGGEIDSELDSVLRSAREATRALDDVADQLRHYEERLEADPDRLIWVDDRLAELHRLQRKHRVESLEDLLAVLARLEEEASGTGALAERESEARSRTGSVGAEFLARAAELHRQRDRVRGELSKALEGELAQMEMSRARFGIEIQPVDVLDLPEFPPLRDEESDPLALLGPTGGDQVEFTLANVGEEPRALRRIASGGELSRVMLGLKTLLAGADEVDTLVFDEIDLGIGGEAARVVGEKLGRIGEERQVLCITHLPALAAYAHRHYSVEKVVRRERTSIRVASLNRQEQIEELARMIAGKRPSQTVRRHAEELLATSRPAQDGEGGSSSEAIPRGNRRTV